MADAQLVPIGERMRQVYAAAKHAHQLELKQKREPIVAALHAKIKASLVAQNQHNPLNPCLMYCRDPDNDTDDYAVWDDVKTLLKETDKFTWVSVQTGSAGFYMEVKFY